MIHTHAHTNTHTHTHTHAHAHTHTHAHTTVRVPVSGSVASSYSPSGLLKQESCLDIIFDGGMRRAFWVKLILGAGS